MPDNFEEWNNDTTLENLTCSVQIYWGCTYLCRRSSEGTASVEEVSLALSNFL